MENINPLFLLQPVIVLAFSIALVVYWHFRRSLRWRVLYYALAAYGIAIALKNVVQFLTAQAVVYAYGKVSVAVGLYYGLQTVIFEVGGAFVVAWLFVSWKRLSPKDAEGYGIGLGFGENGLLLGVLPLINLITYFFVLSTNSGYATSLYDQLIKSSPGLFNQSSDVLSLVSWGILERVSSVLFHFSWGYLCVMAAALGKKKYLLMALPMGLVDMLVPFAGTIGLVKFELLIFGLGVTIVAIALYATKNLRAQTPRH